jgi:hypothetical protein
MNKMIRKETDVAWCAGFFDGEGHVSYHRSYPSITGNVSAQLYANVPQASDNIEVLEFFQSVIGFGKIKGPYKTTHKDKHVIHYGVTEVEPLFKILKPYLRKEKTLDFQVALMAYQAHDSTASIEDYARLIKKEQKKQIRKAWRVAK